MRCLFTLWAAESSKHKITPRLIYRVRSNVEWTFCNFPFACFIVSPSKILPLKPRKCAKINFSVIFEFSIDSRSHNIENSLFHLSFVFWKHENILHWPQGRLHSHYSLFNLFENLVQKWQRKISKSRHGNIKIFGENLSSFLSRCANRWAIKNVSRCHCFPHTFRDTFFFVRYEQNPLRDFLLLLVFANIHSNKFSWQLSITSQNERKETRVVTNDEAILARCDPEKLSKFQEVHSSIETNENKFPARLDSCANVFTPFRDRDEILESSYSNRFANDLQYQNLDQCSTIANGGS